MLQIDTHDEPQRQLDRSLVRIRDGALSHPDSSPGVTPVLHSRDHFRPEGGAVEHRAVQMACHVVGHAGLTAVIRIVSTGHYELGRLDFAQRKMGVSSGRASGARNGDGERES